MKKTLLLFCALLTGIGGAWADVSDYISTDYATATWLRVKNCSNSGYAMSATNTTMGTKAVSTLPSSVQLVAFVGTSSSFKIYSYNLGSTYALKAASNDPGNGTTVSWVAPAEASTWTLDETYASDGTNPGYGICLSGQNTRSLNMYGGAGGDCKFYTFSGQTGSRWKLEVVDKNLVVEDGKVYKISSYQYSEPHTYQIIYSVTPSSVISTSTAYNNNQGYWICHQVSDYYTFESAMGNGYYLAWKGLSTTAKAFDLKTASSTNATTCLSLYSHNNDTGGGRYLYVHKNASGGTNGWNQNGSAYFADGGSTDYLFEEVTSVSIYKVVSNINAGGVTYTPAYTGTSAQTNGGFYILASAPSPSDFTTKSVDNYTAGDVVVDASAKTITVNYTANITYTLTDANGATYDWSAAGSFGVVPSLTGCYGYTLSNEVWDEEARTYTADITFPFPISSNDVTNWTYIGSFASLSRTAQWAWHVQSAGATDVTAQSNVLPTNEDGDINRWKWTIEVSTFSAGAFTFKIKNAATPKYIYCSPTQHNHNQGSVTLEATGTSFVHVAGNAWKVSDASYYLSINSYQPTPADLLQYVGQHGNTHYGTNVGYITPSDFAALKADLKDTYDSFNDFYDDYFSLIGGAYTETVEGALAAAHGNNETVYNVIKDGATNYFTASQFTSYQNAYINAMNGVRYVMPTSSFIRIKNADGSKYVKGAEADNYLTLSASGTDASSIFYLNGSNSLISYTTGLYTYAASVACPIAYAPTYVDLYEFLLGSAPGLVKVHATTNPTGWGHGRYWKDADTGTFVDRTQAESATDYIIESVTSLPVTISSVNYATLYAPVALTIPSGVTAYTATISGDKLVLTPVSTTIPKNTGVLLYSATPDTYNFAITDDVDAIDGNVFSGTVATINRSKTGEVYNSYILSGGSAGVCFYHDGPTTLAGFKAFVDATPSGDVKQFLQFDFGDATAIQTISNALQSESREIYNLAGQRLNSLQRGVNIVNGKKVLVK